MVSPQSLLTTIELEYSYSDSYSRTFFCTRTHEKVLENNYTVGVLVLILVLE